MPLRVAGAQIDLVVGDLAGNEEKIAATMDWAEAADRNRSGGIHWVSWKRSSHRTMNPVVTRIRRSMPRRLGWILVAALGCALQSVVPAGAAPGELEQANKGEAWGRAIFAGVNTVLGAKGVSSAAVAGSRTVGGALTMSFQGLSDDVARGFAGIPTTITDDAARVATNSVSDFVDLTTPGARSHILDGEVRPNGTYSGGHRRGTGYPGKSEFPSGWSDGRILHEISDVATDPAATRIVQGSRTVVTGSRGGVDIRVVIDNTSGEIVTGYPTNMPINP